MATVPLESEWAISGPVVARGELPHTCTEQGAKIAIQVCTCRLEGLAVTREPPTKVKIER